MLIRLRSSSLVRVVLGSMPMVICNRFYEKLANNGKITTFTVMLSCAGFLEPKKLTVGPLKSTFNAENFVCSFSMSISIHFGAFRSWNVSRSPKLPKIHKTHYFGVKGHPRSLNSVPIESQRIYDFLVISNHSNHSNLGLILHRYWNTAIHCLKVANFSHLFHLAFSFGVTFSNL